MRRKLFFFLEKLEVKRSERITISVLMVLLVLLSGISVIQQPYANDDEERYQELEEVFRERSNKRQQEKSLILARYEPTSQDQSDSPPVIKDREEIFSKSKEDTTDGYESLELININTATKEQLQTLPGIGPAYSGRIIEWREENGTFTTKDQLLEIKGIGEKRLENIKPLITL